MLPKLMDVIKDEVILLDGAMGTMLQRHGLKAGDLPELMNLTHPELLTSIHKAYLEAGAVIASANTFGASALKYPNPGQVEEVIRAGIGIARVAGAPWVGLDVGPLGQLMEPMGVLRFDEAYRLFAQQMVVGEQAGADCVLLETFSDLYEIKAAVLAAKENTSLPIFATMTYQGDGRTFVGCDPITATLTLQSLGVDALGINCSLGPKELMPLVEQVVRYAKVPVLVQANAGLPEMADGQAVYSVGPEEYGEYAVKLVEAGVGMIGGCCGTTPAHIAAIDRRIRGLRPVKPRPAKVTAACSGTRTVFLHQGVAVIGERINPTGKKRLKEALREGRMEYILGEALDQADAGADLLDVNVGLPELDEPAVMARVVREIQGVTPLPLQIDSSNVEALERGVRYYNGRPLINSVNGKRESMAAVFPLAKKYGALVVGLTLDENGIPSTAQGRLEIARRLLENALAHGISKEDLLIDPLTLTVSAQQDQAVETLEAVALVKRELGLATVLGVSNVSFGLPAREMINTTFLAAALGKGLNAPILNPLSKRYMETVDAFRVLSGQDRDAARFVERYGSQGKEPAPVKNMGERALISIIIQGRKEESAAKVKEMLETVEPIEIVDQYFIPALNQVGASYAKGDLFLPQLIQSAETVQRAFEVLRDHMERSGQRRESRGKILIATVEGDIHDIGKNIVRMVLENYGYDVIDLGKDVPVAEVVEAARRERVRLIGLSALMTTTVANMKRSIDAVKAAGLDCKFMVGGAVLSEEYKDLVGADYYAKDALDSVAIANRFFGWPE